MDWAILAGVTLAAAVIVAAVAWLIARRMAARGASPAPGVILLAIVISLVVLQGAAKLAVVVDWLYERMGVDAQTALGGQIATVLFAASFVPIAAYVVTFLLVFRKVQGGGVGR